MGGNMSGHESEFTQVRIANYKRLDELAPYSDSSVRAEFENRMLRETRNAVLRMLYAAVAASSALD